MWAYIKKAINSDFSTPLNDRIDNHSVIKSFQTGYVEHTFATGGTIDTEDTYQHNVTISSVNVNKCIFWFVGGSKRKMASGTIEEAYEDALLNSVGDSLYGSYLNTIRLTTSTNLRISHRNTSNSLTIALAGRWYIIEFK